MRFVYSALWWIGLPLVLLRLWRRGAREPGYRRHIGERLGFYGRQRPHRPLIWVHAVSVGETRAAEPLILALMADYPAHDILLTHMTATGRATGAQLFGKYGARVTQSFLPYDTNWMCARFLRHFKPALCVLMETEVWPNLVRQCQRLSVPVMLANARLSERSLRRGQRFASLLRPAANAVACVAAQTTADAQRLVAFGARHVVVTGSLKFDVQPPGDIVGRGLEWRRALGGGERPILLCASTREGEERLILDALANARGAGWLTVLVPRHPQRFDEVEAMIVGHGLSVQRRSAWQGSAPEPQVDVILGDSMGEMFAYYALCDVAFIGGSLLPLGGQNLIEALALGKPVLLGEHTFNFAEVTRNALDAGAAQRVADAAALVDTAAMLFADEPQRQAMATAAGDFVHQHQGATRRTMDALAPLLLP